MACLFLRDAWKEEITFVFVAIGWFLCNGSQGKKIGWIPETFLKKYVDDSLELGDVAEQPKDAGILSIIMSI